MNKVLLIFFGCGFGGLARYFVATATHTLFGQKFPYGTLLVNVTGSFLMGILFTLIAERFHHSSSYLGPLLLVGFLGGYTTFSSFSVETVVLLKMGNYWGGIMNVFASVTLCLLATILGIWAVKL